MAETSPAGPTSSGPSSSTSGAEKRRRSRNWDCHEMLLLVMAKKLECDRYEQVGKKDKYETSADKWGKVVEYLQQHSIMDRDVDMCRSKWDNLLSDYKGIKDYQKAGEKPPYETLRREEKKLHKLPASFDPQILALLDSFQGKRPSQSPPYTLDSSITKPGDVPFARPDTGRGVEGAILRPTHIRIPRQETPLARVMEGAFPRPVTPSSLGSESQYDNVVNLEDLDMHPIHQVHRDREEGFGGKKRRSQASASQLLSDSIKEMEVSYVSTLASMEEKKDERHNKILELERERINIEREDRKELIGVLGTLAKAFEKIANTMTG